LHINKIFFHNLNRRKIIYSRKKNYMYGAIGIPENCIAFSWGEKFINNFMYLFIFYFKYFTHPPGIWNRFNRLLWRCFDKLMENCGRICLVRRRKLYHFLFTSTLFHDYFIFIQFSLNRGQFFSNVISYHKKHTTYSIVLNSHWRCKKKIWNF
jgi:hypothetical protein